MREKLQDVRAKIIEGMIRWGWKDVIGKKRGFEQSLFEHSLNSLDMMLVLLPVLRQELSLTEEEENALILAAATHDAGKGTPEWQAYVHGGEFVSDTNVQLSAKLIAEICQACNLSGSELAKTLVRLHMRHERTPTAVVSNLLVGQDSQRWGHLVDIVDTVDNLVSVPSLLGAVEYLRSSSLGRYLNVEYHLVNIRGVSTTLLHRAAQETFCQAGWQPLLHYTEGTIYISSAREEAKSVTVAELRAALSKAIDEILRQRSETLCELTVGRDIRQTFLPKPELFDYRRLETYLRIASGRVRRKEAKDVGADNAYKYANLRALLDHTGNAAIARLADVRLLADLRKKVPSEYHGLLIMEPTQLSEQEANRFLARMGEAYPEMAIFKFFRYVVDPDTGLIGEKERQLVREAYDRVFGEGSFAALTSTSTLMPAKDTAFTVDYFWRLPGTAVGLDDVERVEYAPRSKREEALIRTLVGIANEVFATMEAPPTIEGLAEKIARIIVRDLLVPSGMDEDVLSYAKCQLQHYLEAKKNLTHPRDVEHLCPICNAAFRQGVRMLADISDRTEASSNRAFAYENVSGPVICISCYYERILRQVILGTKAAELIVLMPRLAMSQIAGEVLVGKAEAFRKNALKLMDWTNPDPDHRLNLGFIDNTARQVLSADLYGLTPMEIVELFAYRLRDETHNDNIKKIVKFLKKLLGEDIQVARERWDKQFGSWEELAEAIYHLRFDDAFAQEAREVAYQGGRQFDLVCQTPNLILMPCANPIRRGSAISAEGDSETKAAIKCLFVELVLSLALDCAVAIFGDEESFDTVMTYCNGVAYVPPVAPLRQLPKLKGATWISVSEAKKWLKALASAFLITPRLDYPPRNDVFEILTAGSPGKLLRRIEMVAEGGRISMSDLEHLENIKEVLI